MKINKKMKEQLFVILPITLIIIIGFSLMPQATASTRVYQLLSDYQDERNGGDGWLRIMTFNPLSDSVQVKTFSPWLNQYQTDENSQFAFTFDLNGTIPFTLIVLPDTQYYSKSYPEIYVNQTKWIVEQETSLNIIFVQHLGDIVDRFDNIIQWHNSLDAMNILKNSNIPYGVLPGNHDFVTWESNTRSYYYQFYGPSAFNNYPYYQGSYNNDNFNNYEFIDFDGNKLMFLNLQYSPTAAICDWAYYVAQENSDRQIILSTHEFVGAVGRTSIGEKIWNSVVVPNANHLQIVLCGHFNGEYTFQLNTMSAPREYMRVDTVNI